MGALGYVAAVAELNAQLEALGVKPNWLALAAGSCGTQAGVLAGIKIHGASYGVLGITVSRPVSEGVARIERIAGEAGKLLGQSVSLRVEEIIVREGFIGAGYGIPSREGNHAIRLVAQTEGIFLDPTYTGKAMAGLMEEIRAGRIGREETVVFLHTGGEPGLFAHAEAVLS